MDYKYVFGPVVSSRLGRSLGLDLLGRKICSFDCLYCEVGPNTTRYTQRAEYVPFDQLMGELEHWLRHVNLPLDYVTMGGSGEPCLHSRLGEILQAARKLASRASTAVLTNSSLLYDPQVRAELAHADAVLPSMDTLVPGEFRKLNRAHSELDLNRIAHGLLDFRQEYKGRIYLEVLLAKGFNDSEKNLSLLRDYVKRLRPDRVDVVTLSRPGAYEGTRGVDADTLQRFRDALGAGEKSAASETNAPGIAISETLGQDEFAHKFSDVPRNGDVVSSVYNSLKRRPQTVAQLAKALDADMAVVEAAIMALGRDGRVKALAGEDPAFYKAV